MYVLNKIRKAIKKNKYKYLVLFLVIIFLNISLFVAGKVYHYDLFEIEEINQAYGSNVTIDINPDYILKNDSTTNNVESSSVILKDANTQIDPLTYEDYLKFSESKYVKETNFQQNIYLTRDNLSLDLNNIIFGYSINRFLEIIGNNDVSNTSEFKLGNNQIVSGRFPENEYEIVLNSNFKEGNDLTLGSRVQIVLDDTTIYFKVVGFYDSTRGDNSIYTTYDTTQILDSSKNNVTAIYTLQSYTDADLFETELYNMGLNKLYYVNNNQNLIDQNTAHIYDTISAINNFKNFLIILLFLVILVISSFILESKKNNLKILRMLGVTKVKLILSYLLEILIVTILSLIFVVIVVVILDKFLLNRILIPPFTYFYIIRDIFFTNLIVLFLVNFETILFINSYNVDKIVSERF